MLELKPHTEGVLLPVKAAPASRQNGIQGVHAGHLKVAVTAAPEKGKANKALAQVLAKQLGLRKSDVQLVQGETSSQKQFLIRGLSVEELQAKLQPLLGDSDPD